MKYFVLIIFFLASCSKHKDTGPVYTSVEGNWQYKTPDGKISVAFGLKKNDSGGLDITSQSIVVDGTSGKAYAELTGVTLPATLGKLRVNANDGKLVYPYSIEFDGGVVSSDFKSITWATAVYTWPFGTDNNLTSVVATRVP